ncbi:MAG: DUF3093 domain-containing protein [Jiangellales bacterium]
MTYAERLHVPVLWWVLAGMGVLSLFLAYDVALGGWAAVAGAVLLSIGLAAWLSGQAMASVGVDATGLTAGLAHLPSWAVGQVEALDVEATRLARTRDADPHGYFALKGYVRTSVRVWVDDPGDPVPYWLVSTRDPQAVATALMLARDGARG